MIATGVLFLSMSAPTVALSVSADSGAEGALELGGSSGASTSAGLTVGASGEVGSGSGLEASNSVQVEEETTTALAPVTITRADVDAGTVGGSAASPSDVHTQGDLYGYIASAIRADGNLSAATASGRMVSVTYKVPARLFAVIPLSIAATATVHADGSVSVSYPWYAFLFAKDSVSLSSNVENAVEADLGTSASAAVAANGNFSADLQARLIADIRSAMAVGVSSGL